MTLAAFRRGIYLLEKLNLLNDQNVAEGHEDLRPTAGYPLYRHYLLAIFGDWKKNIILWSKNRVRDLASLF